MKRLLAGTVSVLSLLASPAPARAAIEGPCNARLGGQDLTTDRDTPGSAVRIDSQADIPFEGESTNGAEVDSADLSLGLAGVQLGTVKREGRDTEWKGRISFEDHAWAGVGLYAVRGSVITKGAQDPICAGTFYLCLTGKSPFTTAAGGAAALLGLIALILFAAGVVKRGRGGTRGQVSWRLGAAGLLGGPAAVVLLQQSCVAALTTALAGTAALGGMAVLGLAGALVAPARAPRRAMRR